MKKNISDDYIIGISYGFHDSAVALIQNGKVLNAVEEERFTGIKHDFSFPINSINWILKKIILVKKIYLLFVIMKIQNLNMIEIGNHIGNTFGKIHLSFQKD